MPSTQSMVTEIFTRVLPHRGHSVKNINQQKKTSQAKRKLYIINRETSQIDWFLLF